MLRKEGRKEGRIIVIMNTRIGVKMENTVDSSDFYVYIYH